MQKHKKIVANTITFLFILIITLAHITPIHAADDFLDAGSGIFPNPLGTVEYQTVVEGVIKTVLGVIGVVALLMFIYGGITWMTSLGNSERVRMGRETLTWAALGLVVVFASFAIVNLILSALNTETPPAVP